MRTAKYTGKGNHASDVGTVRADKPIPATAELYYFEVSIVDAGDSGNITVGLVPEDVSLNRQPGAEPGYVLVEFCFAVLIRLTKKHVFALLAQLIRISRQRWQMQLVRHDTRIRIVVHNWGHRWLWLRRAKAGGILHQERNTLGDCLSRRARDVVPSSCASQVNAVDFCHPLTPHYWHLGNVPNLSIAVLGRLYVSILERSLSDTTCRRFCLSNEPMNVQSSSRFRWTN